MENIDTDIILRHLYKKNKNGSFQAWSIFTHGADIYTKHGKVDGKQQESIKTAKGKNIGKTNETTSSEQANLTAQSMWNKKKDKGYFTSIEDAENEVVFLPMLAHELTDKMREKLEFPVYIQPKMDGVRCLARWDGDKIQLLSRGGKDYNIPHLSEALQAVIEPGQVLDGEIYIHGVLRQDINALVKKHRDEEYEDTGYCSNNLQYWIYDTFKVDNLKQSFEERYAHLLQLNTDQKILIPVPLTTANNNQNMIDAHDLYTGMGFEGSIIRLFKGPYELGHRSRGLLKYKDFQDAEFKIIGAQEGVGKFVGCVTWTCITSNGQEFNVVPKGTLKQKKEWFKDAQKYIGKEITVKYQSLSKDGIPEFPVGIGLRLDKDK